LSGHPWDIYVDYETGQAVASGLPFYGVTEYSYPPVWAGILFLVTIVYRPLAARFGAAPISDEAVAALLGTSPGAPLVADWLFHLLVKAPIIVFDLLLALLLGRIVAARFHKPEKAPPAFAAFFLNPYVIWISSVWGAFDVIPTYFAITGALLLLDGRGRASGLAFGLAVALKYFPIFLLLALLLGLRKNLSRQVVRNLLLGFMSVLGAVSIPFLAQDAVAYLGGILSPASGLFLGNLSIWSLAAVWGLNAVPSWIAVLNIAMILAVIAAVALALGERMSPCSVSPSWIDLCVLALLTFYALSRIVNDQYVFWIVPFLILDALLGRGSWHRVLGVSVLVLAAGLVNVSHYSFFLPILTISTDYAGLIPRMAEIQVLRIGLGITFWVVVIAMTKERITRLGGGAQVISFLRTHLRRIFSRWLQVFAR